MAAKGPVWQPSDEALAQARLESRRAWLPILDDQRSCLRDYQLRILDDVAGFLGDLSSPLISAETSSWRWHFSLRIDVALAGQDGLRIDSWVRIPPKKFIKVGRIDPLDYDQDWRFTEWDLLDYKEVVFLPVASIAPSLLH